MPIESQQEKPLPKKPGPKNKTRLQRKAVKILGEEGGSVSAAMRKAGYSAKTAHNPDKLTGTRAYKDLLNEAGLDDAALAKGQREMAEAAKIQELVFPNLSKQKLVEIDKDDPKWDKAGRDKQYRTDMESLPIADKDIKKIVESVPGCRLLYIRINFNEKVAIYSAPDHLARKAAYEMAMKVKGHYAPEGHTHIFPKMSDDEAAAVKEVLDSI